MTDPIADMLNRIRNAQATKKQVVEVPFSKIKFEIAKILERTGFAGKVDLKTKRSKKAIEIQLKYRDEGPAVQGVKRISKSGQRTYAAVSQLPGITRNHGISIISTSKGLMTVGEARKQNLGGEVLCEIW